MSSKQKATNVATGKPAGHITKTQALKVSKVDPTPHFEKLGGYEGCKQIMDETYAMMLWSYEKHWRRDQETDHAYFWWYHYHVTYKKATATTVAPEA